MSWSVPRRDGLSATTSLKSITNTAAQQAGAFRSEATFHSCRCSGMPSRVWEWRIWIRSIELGDMAEEAQGILLDLDGNILSNLANLTKFVELARSEEHTSELQS